MILLESPVPTPVNQNAGTGGAVPWVGITSLPTWCPVPQQERRGGLAPARLDAGR